MRVYFHFVVCLFVLKISERSRGWRVTLFEEFFEAETFQCADFVLGM